MARSGFPPPPNPREQGWLDLRERLARAAREIHFSAVSRDASHSATLLMIAGNLATLAMSIQVTRSPAAQHCAPTGPVEPYTLLAAQLLRQRPDWCRDGDGRRRTTGNA
jgi:hypothetical protein